MGCDEPRPIWAERERDQRDRRWERIRALHPKLQTTPLSAFTADFALAICIVLDPGVIEGRFVSNDSKVDEALDKLEAFYALREPATKKSATRARKARRPTKR